MSELRMGGQGPYQLKGRVVVIAGGSGGIGAAAAHRLAADGARIIIGYNSSSDRAEAVVAALGGRQAGHMALRLPMDDSAALNAAAAQVEAAFGCAHVLINSAGITKSVPHANLEDLDDESFDRILITNVRGPFATIRAFSSLLKKSEDSIIVNVSSISAETGLGSSIAYCASKAALDTMSKSLARVLGPEVRVISVSPAAVATDFVPGRGREGVEKQAAITPLRRVCEPDDVAMAIQAAITHLRATTGSVIQVDGGRHL